MNKITYLCLMMLLSLPLFSCGDEKDEPSGGGTSSDIAWACSTYVNGEEVGVVITFDSNYSGIYRMIYNGRLTRYYITADRTGNVFDCRLNDSNKSHFVFTVDGNSATMYDGQKYYDFRPIYLDKFYQAWYDSLAEEVKTQLELYKANTDRYPWLHLESAKAAQKTMGYVRDYARADGYDIAISEWETKTVDDGYNQGNASQWQEKYDAQEQKVIGYYNEYRTCGNRFKQVAIKSNYEAAQSTLRQIRLTAKQDGVYLQESIWETKPIN